MTTRFELVDEGFADPCLTTWPRHHIRSNYCCSIWSGRRGSNSLPPPWQGGALPDELRPHIRCIYPCPLPFFNGAPAKICEARFCGEEEKVWRSSQQSCLQDCTMNSRTFDEATRIGLEPTTPSVTGWCSNQLSYRAMIAQVHRFWRLTAGTCVIIPEKRAVVKHEFQKMSKKFGKVRHSGKNTKTKRTEYSLCACGRGSKSRTHGTRFWRPLLYQLSYTPTDIPHSLNA